MNKKGQLLKDWCILNNNNLLNEWNYKKNNILGINIETITTGSNKNVWWKCDKGHEWTNEVYRRVKFGSPCPICNGRRLQAGVNDLLTTHPNLCKEWDYENNKDLKPTDVTRISIKKVHWKCSKCGHKWIVDVANRAVDGHNCPKCSIAIRSLGKHKTALKKSGTLADTELAKDFDYEANYPKTPHDFTPQSNKSVFWKCHICGYKWKTQVNGRKNGKGCPCCSNKVVVKGKNDLATTHPNLAKEWHPTLNKDLKPDMVTYGQSKKVYWLCPKGHTYQATINHRSGVNGTRCPICNSGRQTSFAEQAFYYYIKKEFPDAINKYKADFLERMELDIYIPSYGIAIEYDGAAWHGKDKLPREQKKYRLCKQNNIKLIRVCEEMPELGSEIADQCFGYGKKTYELKYLNEAIKDLLFHITFQSKNKFNVNVYRDEKEILNYLKEMDKDNFETLYPDIAKEWHPTKNKDIKPNMFKPHTRYKVWWLCPKCGNEYYSGIDKRVYGTGCPECGKLKSIKKRSKEIEMLDPNTLKVIRTFSSIAEAGRIMNINHSNISMACQGNTKRPNAGGYKWRTKSS